MKTRLDASELRIEAAAAEFRPMAKQKLRKVEDIIGRVRKSRNVNIRISESDLGLLKERSQAEGLPYQTLITSVLHRYVNHRLVDEEAIRRSLRILRSRR
jgi:predicted DNA binding CopG/RHH family protein